MEFLMQDQTLHRGNFRNPYIPSTLHAWWNACHSGWSDIDVLTCMSVPACTHGKFFPSRAAHRASILYVASPNAMSLARENFASLTFITGLAPFCGSQAAKTAVIVMILLRLCCLLYVMCRMAGDGFGFPMLSKLAWLVVDARLMVGMASHMHVKMVWSTRPR